MTVRNLATSQNKVSFRQSFNQLSMNWTIPKRKDDSISKWGPIDVKKLIKEGAVTKKNGYRFALWRMRNTMKDVRDDQGREIWKVGKISKEWVTINGVTYSLFQFDCFRSVYGIIGGMNSYGGY